MAESAQRLSFGRNSQVQPLEAPHRNVGFTIEAHDDLDTFTVSYYGTREAMVAAGAAPRWLLARKKGGKSLEDELGDHMWFSKRRKNWECLSRWKCAETALQLPGVTPAHIVAALRDAKARPRQTPVLTPTAEESRGFATGLAIDEVIRALKSAATDEENVVADDAHEYRLLVALLHLAETRKGAAEALEQCIQGRMFIGVTVAVLRNLPTWGEGAPKLIRHLRLVVDNTRRASALESPNGR
jgi:hypothetical protein